MSESDADTTFILPWHEKPWRPMAAALDAGRVAHGLLITGIRGVGKRRFAARLAAALLCQARDAHGDACGACTTCRQRLAGTHPDVSRLAPEEGSQTIKVEQIRRFAQTLHLTPQHTTGRLGWIDPADALTPEAANSLLKTLEEPPLGSHLLLISEQPSKLLPTIRSRCQHWSLPPAAPATARAWLEAQGLEPEALAGERLDAPLAALAQERCGAMQLFRQWDQDLARLLHGRADPVQVAERAAAAPERSLWLDWLYRRCNDLMRACLGLPGGASEDLEPALAQGAARLGSCHLEAWSREVAGLARAADSNADWRLRVESVFLDLDRRIH
jgi:DNA polymerase-3 subunit delta'